MDDLPLHALDVFVERLADGVLERVDRRAEALQAERGDHDGAVSVAEAARRLGISTRGVARLLKSGELPSLRVGRRRLVPLGALERFISRGSA